jgi:hypothetical protein
MRNNINKWSRALALAALLALPAATWATSYKPKGYVVDVLSYYPDITNPQQVYELAAMEKYYAFLPARVRGVARQKADMTAQSILSDTQKSAILLQEIARSVAALDDLPEDVYKAIARDKALYDNLSSAAKKKLAWLRVTGNKEAVRQDKELASYFAARKAL